MPFIELLDRPLSELPAWQPAVKGTVEMITMASRSNVGMDALGRFALRYDETANCIYADVEGQRLTLVWPFGYSATEADGVVTVFDPRGGPVASAGEVVELGGGFVGAESLTGTAGDNRCGASSFWIVHR